MPVTYRSLGHLKSLLKVYLLGILFFTFFRLLLIFTNLHLVAEIGNDKWALLAKAMVMGFRFDTVIACYILALPVVILSLIFLAGTVRRWVLKILYSYTAVLFVVAFFFCSVDVPYFNYFFSRLNDTIFNWSGSAGFGLQMVVEEPRFWVFFLVFLFVSILYVFLLRKIMKRHLLFTSEKFEPIPGKQLPKLLPFMLLLWGATFLGIRGRTAQKSPIIPGTAFFSNNAFVNQLGLNPVFSLLRSVLDDMLPENQHFQKLDDAVALSTMSQLLHADAKLEAISPIARQQFSDAPLKGRNIVLVIMESMSTAKMGRFGNQEMLTPFLDSLASQCWSFDNIYSAGIHTYNGVYTTLFAHPAVMHRHTMDHISVPRMAGFSNVLSQHDYQSIFFTTHDELFDNMSGFLSSNEFEHIVGQKDYPASEVKSTLGVPDEFMFRFSMSKLQELSRNEKPFLATFMTGSDHDPIVIPTETGFVRKNAENEKAIVEYADWSLRKFMEYASAQTWFQNSVFVFVADHGEMMGHNAYDIVFSNHRIPF
ncbi:MAG TPA: sulfatase-like hydrolase/transferase, partial [Flavipsychrobacter sp.]|nr:sulfatase-like hydrolase/transferase [Flavipsychrobacter sp.]